MRQALTTNKFQHNAGITGDQKSPRTKNTFSQQQVSIFDTSPDSLNLENSKKKQQEMMARAN
jgi:hypothetical protein